MNAIIRRVVMRAVYGGVALIAILACVAGAIGFGLASGYLFLLPEVGAAPAALIISGALLLIALLIGLIVVIALQSHRARPPQSRKAKPTKADRDVTEGLATSLDWLADNPVKASLAAFSVGIALGRYPQTRKRVLRSLKELAE